MLYHSQDWFPTIIFSQFPTPAILFLKYKSVKSGEEVAGGGMKIQSVMKNYTVLFQHLPAVLYDDTVDLATAKSILYDIEHKNIYSPDSGISCAIDRRHQTHRSHHLLLFQ